MHQAKTSTSMVFFQIHTPFFLTAGRGELHAYLFLDKTMSYPKLTFTYGFGIVDLNISLINNVGD